MSLETWKAEFYPIPANEVKEEDAVSHSLQKWIGLRKENLEKHGLFKFGRYIEESALSPQKLRIDDISCALCHHYFVITSPPCTNCPLYKLRNIRCDRGTDNLYQEWVVDADPEPMIEALEECNVAAS